MTKLLPPGTSFPFLQGLLARVFGLLSKVKQDASHNGLSKNVYELVMAYSI